MQSFLVQYGVNGFVGSFGASEPYSRGDPVVIRSPRGLELGTVLGGVAPRFEQSLDDTASGQLLRLATDSDQTDAQLARELGLQLLAELGPAPVAFVDVEVTLDRRGAVLHALPWGECDLDPLLAELSDRFGLAVRLLDLRALPSLADPPEPKTSCGPDCGTKDCSSGQCGTSSGGCSTGSCSRGAVKSAGELTAYFADLRQKMEAAGRVPLT